MSFIDRFFEVLGKDADKPLVTEVHGPALRPTAAGDLSLMVARARAGLRAYAVERGDRVVLVASNSAAWVAADLAILGEGAIAVPLYARQAPAELAAMIQDAEPRLILADTDELARALGAQLGSWRPVVRLNALFETGLAAVREPPRARDAKDTVTLIYTSGTSGEPKGVMLSVANVDFMLPIIAEAITAMVTARSGAAARVEDRVFHYLPLCFAGSRMVLWMCLFRGNGILLSTNLQNLPEEMKTARPNYYLNVPALLERVRLGVENKVAQKPAPIRALWERGKKLDAKQRATAGPSGGGDLNLVDRAVLGIANRLVFKAIRKQIGTDLDCLICGSAALPADTQRWFEMLGIPVYQVYGLTETTAICTLDRPGQAQAGKVGWAIPGIEMRLGEEDELQVRGPHVFTGYWRRPEASDATRTADGWLRTGDQAELAPDGALKLIGRVKNLLVPTSGHNVAPEPLEERLLRLPGVEQAVVFGHARPYLVAVVTGDMDAASLDAGLEALNEDLPHYRRIKKLHVSKERMTPENGCLTANQKLKRKAIERYFAKAIAGLYA